MLVPAAAVFSILLVVTGAAKLVRPRDVERALSQMGWPRVRNAGVLIGAVEVGVGVTALFMSRALVAQALLYSAFAVWVVVALRSNVPLASCGCLGRDDTPPTVAHVILNVLAAIVSSLAVFGEPLSLTANLATVAVISTVLVGVYLSYVILTDAATLAGARRR